LVHELVVGNYLIVIETRGIAKYSTIKGNSRHTTEDKFNSVYEGEKFSIF